MCCSPWGCKELDMTGQLNNNKDYSPGDNSYHSEELMLEKLRWSFQHVFVFVFFFSFNQNLLSSNCVPNTGNTVLNKMGTTSALMSL